MEDYWLFARMIDAGARVANVAEPLVKYRVGAGAYARRGGWQLLRSEIDDYYANFRVSRDLLELRNLVDCAELIVRSALMRRESRGLHYSRDFPYTLPVSFPTVLVRSARSGRGDRGESVGLSG